MYARLHPPCMCVWGRHHEAELAETKDRGWLDGGRGRGDAESTRGLSQPLSQCKHVLIEIRSSGYNSFADVAARPSLSFSLPTTPTHHPLSRLAPLSPYPAIPCFPPDDTRSIVLSFSLSLFRFRSSSFCGLRTPTPTSRDPRHLGRGSRYLASVTRFRPSARPFRLSAYTEGGGALFCDRTTTSRRRRSSNGTIALVLAGGRFFEGTCSHRRTT